MDETFCSGGFLMKLSEKLELLRGLEGSLRELKRPLTKSEVSRLIADELGEKISVAYLSQLESGKRPHMTETTRELLARFYKVHPAFFVSDPEGYDSTITSVSLEENSLDTWLLSGARQFASIDADLAFALRNLANHDASRAVLLLMGEMMRDPRLLDRLRACIAEAASENAAAPDSKSTPGKTGRGAGQAKTKSSSKRKGAK